MGAALQLSIRQYRGRGLNPAGRGLDFTSALVVHDPTGFGFLARCSNLTAVDLSGLTAVVSIGNFFLGGCSNLTAVDLSSLTAVTSIGDGFLYGCSNLTAIDMTPAMASFPQASHL